MWLIPTWPEKTRMLNEEERYIAIHRVQNENESTNAEDAEEHWLVSLKGAFNLPTVACIICKQSLVLGSAFSVSNSIPCC